MANGIQVLQTSSFKKATKKFHKDQKVDLDDVIHELMGNPRLREQKRGNLSFMCVYKFKMAKQLTLLGYSYEDGVLVLELITLGPHEIFYRDVKNLF